MQTDVCQRFGIENLCVCRLNGAAIDSTLGQKHLHKVKELKKMKRKISLTLLIMVTAIFALAHSISTAAANNLPSANGHGNLTLNNDLTTFSFHANTMKDGIVKGSITLNNRGQDVFIHADIDCLLVVGNTATMSGTITKSNRPNLEGMTVVFRVEDNGEGNTGLPDTFSRLFITSGTFTCDSNLNFARFPIESGNIQVKQ